MIVLEFFRDVFDGIWYFLYLFFCILAFFYVLGIVAGNKREKINKKLKEKKTYDIESGREAAIAAMETKQILSVDDDPNNPGMTLGDVANGNSNVGELKQEGKEEVPAVMVLNSDTSTAASNETAQPAVQPAVVQPATVQPATVQPATVQPAVQPAVQPVVQASVTPPTEAKAEEPLVINSSAS